MTGWQEIRESTATPLTPPQKWGILASFLLTVTFIVPPWIYLVGDLRAAMGPFAYAVADFLFGPVCAACLVVLLMALRERLGQYAPHQMSVALLAAALAAAMFVAAAFFRSANRQYLAQEPGLAAMLLPAWTTIVAGVIATGWHFLGWALLLIGSVGWASRRLPRGLSALYIVAGIVALFVYLLPDTQGLGTIFGVVVSIWQGIVLWKAEPDATPTAGRPAPQAEQI